MHVTVRRFTASAVVATATVAGLALAGSGTALAASPPTNTAYETEQACETTLNFYGEDPPPREPGDPPATGSGGYYCYESDGQGKPDGPGWYIGYAG